MTDCTLIDYLSIDRNPTWPIEDVYGKEENPVMARLENLSEAV
jgi:hypothetical protein